MISVLTFILILLLVENKAFAFGFELSEIEYSGIYVFFFEIFENFAAAVTGVSQKFIHIDMILLKILCHLFREFL